jgi:hypothetical protein
MARLPGGYVEGQHPEHSLQLLQIDSGAGINRKGLPVPSWSISLGASVCLAHELALPGIAVPAGAGIMINPRRCVDPNLPAFRRLRNTRSGRSRNVLSPDSGDRQEQGG